MFLQLSFNVWKGLFKYEYHAIENRDPELAKIFPTEIFVPELQYPNKQYVVEVSKDLTWRRSPFNEDIIQIFVLPHSSRSSVKESINSRITIKPILKRNRSFRSG